MRTLIENSEMRSACMLNCKVRPSFMIVFSAQRCVLSLGAPITPIKKEEREEWKIMQPLIEPVPQTLSGRSDNTDNENLPKEEDVKEVEGGLSCNSESEDENEVDYAAIEKEKRKRKRAKQKAKKKLATIPPTATSDLAKGPPEAQNVDEGI